MTRRDGWRVASLGVAALLAFTAFLVFRQLPAIAAGGLLHPSRRPVSEATPHACRDATFDGEGGVTLRGWRCAAVGEPHGTVIFLHGVANNRARGAGLIPRFTAEGFDVIAYDSRAHGESSGDACTYGYFEKSDLRRVIDTVRRAPVVLIGSSLGGAVALQEAADDSRVRAIVAAEVFSDLRTVARERAPRFLPAVTIREAFVVAEQRGRFHVDEVSPVLAAARIRVPVLLIHGGADTDTTPDHSERVFAALQGRKRLIVISGARHNQSLSSPEIWQQIDRWIESALAEEMRAGAND